MQINRCGVTEWKSNAPEIALVDTNGLVIAHKTGTAVISEYNEMRKI